MSSSEDVAARIFERDPTTRPMVYKFLARSKLAPKLGVPRIRVMTDFRAERFWRLVAEMEVASVEEVERGLQGGSGQDQEAAKEMEKLTKGYHDFVEHGRREIYKIEGWQWIRDWLSDVLESEELLDGGVLPDAEMPVVSTTSRRAEEGECAGLVHSLPSWGEPPSIVSQPLSSRWRS